MTLVIRPEKVLGVLTALEPNGAKVATKEKGANFGEKKGANN